MFNFPPISRSVSRSVFKIARPLSQTRSLGQRLIALLLVYALLIQCMPPFSRTASARTNFLPAELTRESTFDPSRFKSAFDTELSSVLSPQPPVAETIKDAVISRHKPTLTSGVIEGSLRVLLGESFTIPNATSITSDVYLPGAPSVQVNNGAQHGGVVSDGGANTPDNYTLTLANNTLLPGRIHTHSDTFDLPTVATSVPLATGTRTVNISSQSQVASIGNWQTVRDLNINGSHITVDMAPGNYGTLTINGNSQVNLSEGTYNFANTFNLDGSAKLQATGAVVINVAKDLKINSGALTLGSYTAPADVRLNVLGSQLTINGSSQVSALISAYNGHAKLSGKSIVRGRVIADTVTLNGGRVLAAVWPVMSGSAMTLFGPRRFDRTSGQPNYYVEQFSLPEGTTSPFTLHIQNGSLDGTNRVDSAVVKVNGVSVLTQSDLNENVASVERTITLGEQNQLDVSLASDPGSYLIIYVTGTIPGTDTTAPLVAVTSPANNSTTTENQITVSGTASDPNQSASGIANVYVNDVEASYSSSSNTWTLANVSLTLGANQLVVRAVDHAGNQTTVTLNVTREAPENHSPTVDAGADQTITLPSNAALDGNATDDGLPEGSSLITTWSKVSGPGTVTFTDEHAVSTTASFSTHGTYILRLTATDGDLSTTDEVTITVEPQNQPPTVSAGADQTIALPSTATLNGVVTDDALPVGGTVATTWSKVSGPGTVTFEDPTLRETAATFSESGIYVLRLTATDSELSSLSEVTITVHPENQAPTVNAGADQIISLPADAQLNGTAADDGWPFGSTLTTTWTMVSGPGTVTFAAPNVTVTTASFSAPGTYVLRLTASDGQLSTPDDLTVIVTPPNQAPVVNAGEDQIISLPQDTITLNGSAADDGLPLGSTFVVTWTKLSGPGDVTFGNASQAATTAQFTLAGDYVLRLTASDGTLSAFDDLFVKVTPPNQSPTVSAGADQTVVLPGTGSLNGSVSDDDLPLNATVSTTWSKVSGPGTVTFGNPNVTVTTVSFSVAGTYILRLTATDSQLAASEDLQVIVIPQNFAPSVNAGADQTISLPNTASLNGSVSDDGLPAGSTLTTLWTKVSGPGDVTFANASVAVTTAAFSAPGSYVLKLTANDTEFTVSDELTITAIDPRLPPIASFTVPQSTGAAGGFVIASSGAPGSAFAPDLILDSSINTSWTTNGPTNQFAKIQFYDQQSVYIDRVRIQGHQGGVSTSNVKDFQVQISATTSDDASFVTVLNATYVNNGQLQEFLIPGGPARARFVKYLPKNNHAGSGNIQTATFNPVAVANIESVISLPGESNGARSQSPVLYSNGGVIHSFSYTSGNNSANGLLGYATGGWTPPNAPNQFAIVQLGGNAPTTIKGVKIAKGQDFGINGGVKDFEIWVSSTTADAASFTHVLTATVPVSAMVHTYLFPSGPVQARYVKYIPLTNTNGIVAVIDTEVFDVLIESGARVVGVSGEWTGSANPGEASFDGDPNSIWYSSAATNAWIKTSLTDEAVQKLYGVRIQPQASISFQEGPKDFEIRVSTTTTDDSAFTTVFTGTVGTAVSNSPPQEFLFPSVVDAKYVQFFWKNGYQANRIGVRELEALIYPTRGAGIVAFSSQDELALNCTDLEPFGQVWSTASSQNVNQWIKLVMPRGEIASINHIAVRPGLAGNGFYGPPKDFELQVSTTDVLESSFTTVLSGTFANNTQIQDYYFPTTQARFVRLLLKNNYGHLRIGIASFYVYSADEIGTTTRFFDQSTDADGPIVSWAWDFGDGGTSSEQNPTHTFAQPGNYTVTLTVVDHSGLTHTRQTAYRVVPAIKPNFTHSPIFVHEQGELVRFTDITRLMVQPTAERRYAFGDGGTLSQQASSSVYTYPDSGTFNATIKLGDAFGATHTASRTVVVLNMPPTVSIDPGKTVVWGENWTSVPTISDQSPVDRLSLTGEWVFGDDQTSSCINCTNANATVTHAYSLPGTYTAVLTITDKDGGVGSDSAVYNVIKRPTAVTFLATQSQGNGETYLVRAKLMDAFGNLPLMNKTLNFTLNGVTASAVTDAAGIAEAIFTFAPGALVGHGAATFIEDVMYQGSSAVFGDPLPPLTPPSGVSTWGKDFWVVTLDNFLAAFGSVNVQFHITSDVATTGTVTQQSTAPINFSVPANGVTKVPPGLTNYLFNSDTIENKGVHVTSQQPITLMELNNFTKSTDAYLAFPTEALGTEYIVLGYANGLNIQGTHFGIVAPHNGTIVTITPTITTGPRVAGVPFTITLNQGQTYYLRNDEPGKQFDFTGTEISSTKPVAVFAGHKAGSVPDGVLFATHLVEQLTPVNTWGRHFVTMPYKSRNNGDTFRFMAAEDNTSVYLNGQRVALLNRAQFHERIINGPAYIVSDKPILVAQYANGARFDGGTGDPSMALIPPYEQYLNNYVVASPDFGVAQFINVIAPTSTIGSVILDGAAIPASSFVPISTSGFSGAQMTVARGVHTLSGPSGFGVSLYGFDLDDAYSFQGGLSLRSTAPAKGITLTPDVVSATIGNQQCVTVSLKDQFGVPLGSQSINFSITGANASSSSATTNAAGQANLCYTGANTGTDSITATSGNTQATATIIWTPPNQPPVVNAGANQIAIVNQTVSIAGSVTDDGLPANMLSSTWTKVSGPGNVIFGNAILATTTAVFDTPGVYVLRLTATDTQLSASDDLEVTVSAIPDQRDTLGKEFWLAFPQNGTPQLFLFITAESAASGTVAIPGLNFTTNFNVAAGSSTTVSIPVGVVAFDSDQVQNKGIHVTATSNVSVYGLSQKAFTSEAFTALPTDALGTEYVLLGYTNTSNLRNSLFIAVGTEDGTILTVTPPMDMTQFNNQVAGGYFYTRKAAVPYNVSLNKGQTFLLYNTDFPGDISGTTISSNKPVAVFGGHSCAFVPSANGACNQLIEQLPAVDSLGKDFVTMPLATRTGGDRFRFAAVQNDTHVSVNGVPVATLNRGQFHERLITGPARITSDKAILAVQYSNGLQFDNTNGDPFMMLMVPPEQFLKSYVLKTPPTSFDQHFINVIVPTANVGSIMLDGAALSASFVPIGSSGYSGAQVQVSNGTHTLSAPVAFGAYLYGYAAFDAYGFPAGMSLNSINLGGRISLTPLTSTGLVGTQHCVVATLRNAGNLPVPNFNVDFNVAGANPTSQSAQTDAAGLATFCYTGTVAGVDTVSATAGGTVDTATRSWTMANQPPVVNAGPDLTTFVGVNTQLNGSVTDDGKPVELPLTVRWTVVSGPGSVQFDPTDRVAVTNVRFNSSGTYTLRLTGSDSVLSTTDDIVVTVPVTPPNQPPSANAGPDLSASIFGNIVANGSNEQSLVNGEIPAWVEVQGTGWTQANSATSAGYPEPQRGSSYFFANDAPVVELRQDIDVRAFAANIAAGTQQFEFKTYVRSATEVMPDSARVILEYRNAANAAVIATLDSGVITSTTAWHLTEDIRTVPAGTGWIRIRLLATLNTGPTNDAFFDAISLRPVGGASVTLNGVATDDGLPPPGTLQTTWSKISGPGTVSFANANAPVTGAAFSTPGTYVLRLTVRDLQLFTAIDDVTVTIHAANQPPSVNAGANQTITLPATASLTGTVNDDGQPPGSSVSVNWSKVSGPGIVTFGNSNAASTTASFSTAGTYVLRLTADDSEYGASSDVTITVNPAPVNQPPSVEAGQNQTISLPTDTVTLNGVATDDGLPVGSTLTVNWTMTSGPGVVTFGNANSAITTAQFSASGSYVLRLTAGDGEYVVFDEVAVLVTPQNQAPTANAGADQTVLLSQTAQLDGSASDDGLPSGTLTTSWSKASGPGTVTFINPNHTITGASFSEIGTYVLRLTANDTSLTGFDEVTITVIENVALPTVEITAPTDGSELTEPTAVTGSVSNGDWAVEYSLNSQDGAANQIWTQFGSGSGPVTNALLGTLDTTSMLNGTFAVRLKSTDEYGQTSFTSISVVVDKGFKVGQLQLAFSDLSVPVAGLPIEVIRSYDSRDKRVGDFGVGWQLGLRNARVEKTSVLGLGWHQTQSSGVIPTYCLEPSRPHKVTVTFGDGKVFKFLAATSIHCQQFVPVTSAQMTFTPQPGTHATLEVVGPNDILVESLGSIPGPVRLLNQNNPDIFNSFTFRLTTAEGVRYVINQQTGVSSVADPYGNTLNINANGVVHSSGKSIAFTRDGLGRITEIADPNGNKQTYTYDNNGDLVTFKDRENNETTFTYNSDHHLMTIVDARGVNILTNQYDPGGRLIGQTDAFNKSLTFNHDTANRVEIITDRLGRETRVEYDERGNVLRQVDAKGGVKEFTYDEFDNVLTEKNELGKVTTYTYDEADNRTSIKDPLNNLTQFTYNAARQVLTITDARNKVTTNTYDPAGTNLLTTTDPLTRVTTYGYSIFTGQRTLMKDALNNQTTYDYDGAGRLISETDPLGNTTTYGYDENSNRTTQTVKRTNAQGQLETITTTFTYDKLNRLTKTTFADGSFTQVEYNSMGQQRATIDQLGHRTEFTYDDMGRQTRTDYPDGTHEESTYDAEGRRLTSKDRAGHVTSFEYDDLGRLTKTTYADNTFTSTTYNAASQVVTTTDARGNVTTYFYDDAGRRTKVKNALNQETIFTYDANGNQLTMKDALLRTTTFEYDDNNRRVKTIYHDNSFETTAYDELGRQASRTDQAGKTTQFFYDKLSRLTKVKDALNQETTYTYDERGQQLTQTDANNHTTHYQYDQLGRRSKRVLPGGQFETYAYSIGGNLESRVDFNGKTTTYTYDSMRRMLTKVPDASLSQPTVTLTYNANGQRATMNDASGETVYTYDVRNRLASKQTPFGTLTYTYDNASNLLTTRSSNANGVSVDYTYDVLNRLSTVKDNRLLTLNGGVTSYDYDTVGNLESYQYPNGVKTSYTYNTLNRLTSMNTALGATTQSSYTYTLGPAGNRTAVSELGGRTVNYTYDDLYRLTNETIANDPNINGSIGYNYDPVGNRLSRTSSVTGVPSQSSTYDANDRLNSDTYDANGNTTASNSNSYGYDFENRLTSLNNGAVTYVYDGDGNRVSKTVGGVSINYLVDTHNHTGYAQVVEELQSNAVVKQFTFGHDLISQRIVGGSLSFYSYDGHGSVRQLTDASATITDSYDYDAFGILIHRTGTTPNDYLYTGEQLDAHLGFYYLRARYMSPATGRFWSMDVFEGSQADPISLHKYLYANGNPVDNFDPSGFTAISINETLGVVAMIEGLQAALTALLMAAAIVGVVAYVRQYFDRPWSMELVTTRTPNFHMYIFAKDTRKNAGWRYDIGLDRRGAVESIRDPFGVLDGTLWKRWVNSGDIDGLRSPMVRLSDRQFNLWDLWEFGVPDFTDQGGDSSVPFRYRRLPGPNCTTWSIKAMFVAQIMGVLPF